MTGLSAVIKHSESDVGKKQKFHTVSKGPKHKYVGHDLMWLILLISLIRIKIVGSLLNALYMYGAFTFFKNKFEMKDESVTWR